MAEVGSVYYRPADLAARTERPGPERARPRAGDELGAVVADPADRVELSESALNYDAELVAARAVEERMAGIRARIADDTYITPNKIDVVVARLYEEVVRGAN